MVCMGCWEGGTRRAECVLGSWASEQWQPRDGLILKSAQVGVARQRGFLRKLAAGLGPLQAHAISPDRPRSWARMRYLDTAPCLACSQLPYI